MTIKDYGLYVHIPFCASKCPYCGFYSVNNADDSLKAEYLKACIKELKQYKNINFDTIYIGGGTPSVLGGMLAPFIGEMLNNINYTGKEFTVEVNPESINAEFVKSLSHLPLSRVSMGCQSTNDEVLKMLGRLHNRAKIYEAYQTLRAYLPKADINLDLIYDIPNVPFDNIAQSVEDIVNIQPEHLSAYSYTNDTGYMQEENTDNPFQMEKVKQILQKNGYFQYEVSNYSKRGHEAVHNMKYWQMKPYIGIGASAHSMTDENIRTRFSNENNISAYMKNPVIKKDIEKYDAHEALMESIVFGLRMKNGINIFDIEEKYCKTNDEVMKKIKHLIDEGLLEWKNLYLRPTEKGLLLLSSVMSFLW